MLFDNFTIRECSLKSREETRQVNLIEHISNKDEGSDIATGFAIDKELGTLAVATQTGVHIFDY